jgi:hypothetical protein
VTASRSSGRLAPQLLDSQGFGVDDQATLDQCAETGDGHWVNWSGLATLMAEATGVPAVAVSGPLRQHDDVQPEDEVGDAFTPTAAVCFGLDPPASLRPEAGANAAVAGR